MTAKPDYRSDVSEAIHSSAAMLCKVGALDKATMRDFDTRHLAVPDRIDAAQVPSRHARSRPVREKSSPT